MLTEKQKKERGWYYVGHDKFYWRNCDNCGLEYRGMGSNFCSRKCSANLVLSEEDDGTISIALKKRSTGHNYSAAISKSKRGKPNLKIRGENHPKWKGGRYKTERLEAMSRFEYIHWRRSVFERDVFKCKVCKKGGRVEAHHIYRWADYPELRYQLNNGITLCKSCHPIKKEDEIVMAQVFIGLINQQ